MEIKVRWTEPNRRQRMALMVTREPHCAEALLAGPARRPSQGLPAALISNRRDLEPLARRFRLPFLYIPWHDRAAAERRVLRLLERVWRWILWCWRGL